MSKNKYPKGCQDMGRLVDHMKKTESAKKRAEYLSSRKEEKGKEVEGK